MDETFKTACIIYKEFNVIHAPVGISPNSKICSLVYALTSSKEVKLYVRLFQEWIEWDEEYNLIFNTEFILSDFVKVTMKALF